MKAGFFVRASFGTMLGAFALASAAVAQPVVTSNRVIRSVDPTISDKSKIYIPCTAARKALLMCTPITMAIKCLPTDNGIKPENDCHVKKASCVRTSAS
ncbi:MAG: hypothetical protein M3Z16_02475, partial [Pseudomonadota bacterium]|nr:hypothetical protein [Pseudomonadota bacterium]